MDDALRFRTLYPIRVNMGHHVMAHDALPLLGHVIVNVLRVRFQFLNLLVGNGKPQLLLRLREGNP